MGNKRYTPIGLKNCILSVDAFAGTIQDRIGNALTLTDMKVVRHGDIWVPIWNSSTSKIDCGSDLIGLTELTILTWIKPFSWGELGEGRIMDNGKARFWINTTSSRLNFTSDSLNIITSAANSIVLGKWNLACVKRTSAGIANFYINGELSGTADQNSGNPIEGATNLIIGNNNDQVNTFNGLISDSRIIIRSLTAQEFSQVYTSEKHLYQG